MTTDHLPAAELLPPPAVLRERLSAAMQDVDLLRRLLRLSEKAATRKETSQPGVRGVVARG